MNFISRPWYSACHSVRRLPRNRSLFLFLLPVFLSGLAMANAQAGILVSPTRITLEPGERVGQVHVMNNGAEPVTLRISFVNYHMHSDGSFIKADEPLPGEHFADEFLRYAPRRIYLEPGEGQTVRVLARPPSGKPAEYRSHLRFQTEPPVTPQDNDAPTVDKQDELSIDLVPLFGVSIPVIVRTGDLYATTSIDNLALRRGPQGRPFATFLLQRSGNRSVYGDVRLYLTPEGGKERLVGETLGFAVYPPLAERRVTVPFNKLDTSYLPPGRLRVVYVDHDDESRVLAEAERVIR